MSEHQQTEDQKPDRWKSLVLVLTLINTVIAAALSGLQVDADIRANQANRDSQYYAAQASSELVRQGQESSYEFQSFAIALKASQETLMNEFTALSLEKNGDSSSAKNFHTESKISQARADTARKFSMFYSDPRYAPAQPDGLPNAKQYLADQADAVSAIVVKQNAASDAYQIWNNKSDGYTTILTLLAIVFFLLGVAQSSQRMRRFFSISAIAIMLFSLAWSFLILVG